MDPNLYLRTIQELKFYLYSPVIVAILIYNNIFISLISTTQGDQGIPITPAIAKLPIAVLTAFKE